MKISQSFYKDVNNLECLYFLFLKYVKGLKTAPTEAMFKGLYFEWHLLGATRGGVEPIFEPLKGGGRSKPQQDLDLLVERSKKVLKDLGVDVENGQKQVRLENDLFEGHLDLITNDIQNKDGKAIYDVKYTETKFTDRWNGGWADADNNEDIKIQATHYTFLYWLVHGEFIPFYYIVFGKSGWVRVFKMISYQSTIDNHIAQLSIVNEKLQQFNAAHWPASPEFNRCNDCPLNKVCNKKATKPTIEQIEM